MSQIDIIVNGRTYTVACDDGQEDHLLKLGGYISSRVDELTATIGQVGEARLMLMAGLMIADELSDSLGQVEDLRDERDSLSGKLQNDPDKAMAVLDNVAARLETIAAKLEES